MVKMLIGSQLREDIKSLINRYGKVVRFTYFSTQDNDSSYDDSIDLIYNNTTWTSGLVFPINTSDGSSEATLIEQGRLLNNDTTLYVLGNINTSGTFRVGFGSPVESEYSLIENFVTAYEVGNIIVYKKLFLRRLPTGSFINENIN